MADVRKSIVQIGGRGSDITLRYLSGKNNNTGTLLYTAVVNSSDDQGWSHGPGFCFCYKLINTSGHSKEASVWVVFSELRSGVQKWTLKAFLQSSIVVCVRHSRNASEVRLKVDQSFLRGLCKGLPNTDTHIYIMLCSFAVYNLNRVLFHIEFLLLLQVVL